jgi:hypothetical protein
MPSVMRSRRRPENVPDEILGQGIKVNPTESLRNVEDLLAEHSAASVHVIVAKASQVCRKRTWLFSPSARRQEVLQKFGNFSCLRLSAFPAKSRNGSID